MAAPKGKHRCSPSTRNPAQLARWDRLVERAVEDLKRGRRVGWSVPARVGLALNCFRYVLRELREASE
jgi:hypothetical protein